MQDQKLLQSISSYTSKILRKKFGKGPELCFASKGSHFIVIFIRGFISPMEDALLDQEEYDTAASSRNKVVKTVIPELIGVIQSQLECDVGDVYHDWSYDNNTGVIIARLQIAETLNYVQDEEQTNLLNEIKRISALVQKVPENTTIFKVSPSIYIIIREGILIPIEQTLLKKGFINELRSAKSELEKNYFHHYGRFDAIFNSAVKDIFFDWELKKDKGIICFILEGK